MKIRRKRIYLYPDESITFLITLSVARQVEYEHIWWYRKSGLCRSWNSFQYFWLYKNSVFSLWHTQCTHLHAHLYNQNKVLKNYILPIYIALYFLFHFTLEWKEHWKTHESDFTVSKSNHAVAKRETIFALLLA